MSENFEINKKIELNSQEQERLFNFKKQLLEKDLSFEILSNPEKGLNDEQIEEAEKIFGGKNKLEYLISDLLNENIIVKKEEILSQKQNEEKIKNDIVFDIKKKINFYVENYEDFLKCQETFSNEKNLEDFLKKIEQPLLKIIQKIRHYDINGTKRSEELNIEAAKNGKTLIENPAEIFKFFMDSEYVKNKRMELHNIKEGLYIPYKNNPDGGDGWNIKKTNNKDIGSVIDTEGHGVGQSYLKLFIEKMISLASDNVDDLVKIDNFLSKIEGASNYSLTVKASITRVKIERDINKKLKMKVEMMGDGGFFIYRPKTNELLIAGFDFKEKEYLGVKDIKDRSRKTIAIGEGLINAINLKNSTDIELDEDDQVYCFSDGGRGGIKDTLENIGKNTNLINGENIVNEIKNREMKGKQKDDITILKVR